MSNKKQTAVEWLIEELQKRDMDVLIRDLYNQAKEMEKQQIINAHGIKKDYSFSQIDPQIITGEQYYKETYENNH